MHKKAAEGCVEVDLAKPLTEEEKQELLEEIDNIALEMWGQFYKGFKK